MEFLLGIFLFLFVIAAFVILPIYIGKWILSLLLRLRYGKEIRDECLKTPATLSFGGAMIVICFALTGLTLLALEARELLRSGAEILFLPGMLLYLLLLGIGMARGYLRQIRLFVTTVLQGERIPFEELAVRRNRTSFMLNLTGSAFLAAICMIPAAPLVFALSFGNSRWIVTADITLYCLMTIAWVFFFSPIHKRMLLRKKLRRMGDPDAIYAELDRSPVYRLAFHDDIRISSRFLSYTRGTACWILPLSRIACLSTQNDGNRHNLVLRLDRGSRSLLTDAASPDYERNVAALTEALLQRDIKLDISATKPEPITD